MATTSSDLLQRAQIILLRDSLDLRAEDQVRADALAASSSLVHFIRRLCLCDNGEVLAKDRNEMLAAAVVLWLTASSGRGDEDEVFESVTALRAGAVEQALRLES